MHRLNFSSASAAGARLMGGGCCIACDIGILFSTALVEYNKNKINTHNNKIRDWRRAAVGSSSGDDDDDDGGNVSAPKGEFKKKKELTWYTRVVVHIEWCKSWEQWSRLFSVGFIPRKECKRITFLLSFLMKGKLCVRVH